MPYLVELAQLCARSYLYTKKQGSLGSLLQLQRPSYAALCNCWIRRNPKNPGHKSIAELLEWIWVPAQLELMAPPADKQPSEKPGPCGGLLLMLALFLWEHRSPQIEGSSLRSERYLTNRRDIFTRVIKVCVNKPVVGFFLHGFPSSFLSGINVY